MPGLDPALAARLKRDADGLVAAVVQQHDTGEVLMLAWMDDEALRRTLTTGRATYWSRSRQDYWVKGAASGHR
ncbi:MAG: phosphoribosyl-AMP cyclohydrolase, partial [Acidimicrobiales bacterium]